ncbi:MAG: DUF3137 domain-containing protein [Chitinophagaceae bacterium]|nr:DUF3137 domain-containing protein [Chitinophagaceae bacterium]
MQDTNSFSTFYHDQLSGLVEQIEMERRKLVRRQAVGYILTITSVIALFISMQSDSQGLTIGAMVVLIAGITLWAITWEGRKGYVRHFKETIVRKVIEFIDPSFQYHPKGFINENDYKRSGLILDKHDDYEGDDYVEGKRERTFFCFSELKTTRTEGSGKSRRTVTLFNGLFFIADFNKNISGRTYVWSEANPQLDFFKRIFSSVADGLEKVKLESTEFESRFIVYSTDQVQARYILTPSFMERMLRLEQKLGTGISFSFLQSEIYVAVPVKDKLFEPTFFRPNDYESVGDYYNTVHAVIDIIDELRLNDRLWGKE